jgi:alpha-D-ribose 1-methylphosphonate 5-triphosphate synthase subunit PhnL
MTARLEISGIAKSFTLHLQDGGQLPVLAGVDLTVRAGECVVVGGPSGTGKSSLLRMVYGNYRCSRGHILVHGEGSSVDIAEATPRQILDLRRRTIGYVSQFLRVIPRISAQDVVAEPLMVRDVDQEEARERARHLLQRLAIPRRLWSLPPATFSGGEQQRVNIARGFIADFPILLLDEPTASLDAANRASVVELIEEKLCGGTAVLGVFHDADVRDRVASRIVDLVAFSDAA